MVLPTFSDLSTWLAICKHLPKSLILRAVWSWNTKPTEDVWTSADLQDKKKQVQTEKLEDNEMQLENK